MSVRLQPTVQRAPAMTMVLDPVLVEYTDVTETDTRVIAEGPSVWKCLPFKARSVIPGTDKVTMSSIKESGKADETIERELEEFAVAWEEGHAAIVKAAGGRLTGTTTSADGRDTASRFDDYVDLLCTETGQSLRRQHEHLIQGLMLDVGLLLWATQLPSVSSSIHPDFAVMASAIVEAYMSKMLPHLSRTVQGAAKVSDFVLSMMQNVDRDPSQKAEITVPCQVLRHLARMHKERGWHQEVVSMARPATQAANSKGAADPHDWAAKLTSMSREDTRALISQIHEVVEARANDTMPQLVWDYFQARDAPSTVLDALCKWEGIVASAKAEAYFGSSAATGKKGTRKPRTRKGKGGGLSTGKASTSTTETVSETLAGAAYQESAKIVSSDSTEPSASIETADAIVFKMDAMIAAVKRMSEDLKSGFKDIFDRGLVWPD